MGSHRHDSSDDKAAGKPPIGTFKTTSKDIEKFLDSFKFVKSAPDGWKEFRSQEGKFSALFPGTPKLEHETIEGSKGKMEMYTASFTDGNGVEYKVVYADVEGVARTDKTKILDAGTNGTVADGKLRSSRDFTLNGAPSREIVVDTKDGFTVRKRICLVGDRVYQVSATTARGAETTSDVEAFMESFEWMK